MGVLRNTEVGAGADPDFQHQPKMLGSGQLQLHNTGKSKVLFDFISRDSNPETFSRVIRLNSLKQTVILYYIFI